MDFEAIYAEHFFSVYKYILSLCRDTSLAEEITQETFYRAMESFHRFRGDCSVFVWLCQIGKNTYYRHTRRQRRFSPELTEDVPSGPESSMEERLFDREDAERLHRLLHGLPEPYREVFTLRTFGELPFSRIGELFGKTDSWARLVYYRAKNELRRKFHESDL